MVGLIGPNGSGKTTTMRLLVDLIRPTAGTARVRGLDCRGEGVEVRRRVGSLPGDHALDRQWTARRQLRWFAALRGAGADRIEALAERLDLTLDRAVGELSTGNRQKVGLVQAFMHGPEVVVLDEPAAGLDPVIRRRLWELLRETAASGRTVFLSSHVLGDVEEVCDRVAILRDGSLVVEDDVPSLLDRRGRSMRITFAAPVDPAPFAALAGVGEVHADGPTLSLHVAGPVEPVLAAAVAQPTPGIDLVSTARSLEDEFLSSVAGPADLDGLDDAS